MRWFSTGNELVTASTDTTLKLWSLPSSSAPASLPALASSTAAAPTAPWLPQLPALPPPPDGGPPTAAPANGPNGTNGVQLVRTFAGHANERNFVGLCTDGAGDYIACGSEAHEVVVYHRSLPRPTVSHSFAGRCDRALPRAPFMSHLNYFDSEKFDA